MLIQFSIANSGGNTIVSYERDISKFSSKVLDMDLVSNFLQAMQLFSESIGTSIKEIVFSNIFLYIQTYGDFTIRLMLDEKTDIDMKPIFSESAKIMYDILSRGKDIEVLKSDQVESYFLPILAPLIEYDAIDKHVPTIDVPIQPPRPKIAIVGLEKAGKTSVKKAFFEKWPLEMIQKIRPTLGIETLNKKIDYLGQQFMIMDYGGQLTFRKQYLSSSMKWKGISILIFIIDVQKEDTFEEAAEYLENVWKLALEANTKPPRLSVFFHKFDPDKYSELALNIGKCMVYISRFLDRATIYTTSIENESCTSALIKTIYFGSPDIVIRKLFDEIILTDFEEKILAKFLTEPVDWNDETDPEVVSKLKNTRIIAKQMGKDYGMKLQEIWFSYFAGEWAPKQSQLKWNILDIETTKKEMYIRIRYWVDPDTSNKPLILRIFDGLLEGIAVTLQMKPPKRIDEEGFFGVWKYSFI
jgi:GTPase SAR1 family protein